MSGHERPATAADHVPARSKVSNGRDTAADAGLTVATPPRLLAEAIDWAQREYPIAGIASDKMLPGGPSDIAARTAPTISGESPACRRRWSTSPSAWRHLYATAWRSRRDRRNQLAGLAVEGQNQRKSRIRGAEMPILQRSTVDAGAQELQLGALVPTESKDFHADHRSR